MELQRRNRHVPLGYIANRKTSLELRVSMSLTLVTTPLYIIRSHRCFPGPCSDLERRVVVTIMSSYSPLPTRHLVILACGAEAADEQGASFPPFRESSWELRRLPMRDNLGGTHILKH